jgi:hypothetical protein
MILSSIWIRRLNPTYLNYKTNYRLKSNEINQRIDQITEEKLKSERIKNLIQSLKDNLHVQEKLLHKISHQRQLDNEEAFQNLLSLLHQIEQIQTELKDYSK